MNFSSITWFWRCKEHPCPLSPHLGHWRMLEVPDLGLASWSWFWYDIWSFIYQWSKFWLSILTLKVQRTSMSCKSLFGALEDAGSLFGYGHWSLIYPWSKFWLSSLTLKVQRTSMSFKSSFRALEDVGGFWLGCVILIMIHKGSLWSVKLVLKFTISSAKFQLSYLLSSAQKICCLRGGWVQPGSGCGGFS